MARRRELRDVANLVVTKFGGRNNDHDGYWAMGQLYAELTKKPKTLHFDLLKGAVIPTANVAEAVATRFSEYLREVLRRKGLNERVVKSAVLDVEFESSELASLPPRLTRGELFVANLEIVDDLGRAYRAQAAGWCAPHADHEHRRALEHRCAL